MNVVAKLFVVFLTLALVLPQFALALTIDQEINRINGEIDQRKLATDQAQNQLSTSHDTLNQLIQEYQEAYSKLQEIDQAIAKKERELSSATEQQIFYQKILNKLSVFTYRDGDVYFFEVVLGTRSFKDLIVRLDYLVKMNQRQADILRAAKRLRGVVKERRDELAAEKSRQKEMVAAIQAKQDNINRLLAEQQNLLNSLGGDIARLEAEKKKREQDKVLLEEQEKARQSAAAGPVAIDMIFPIPKPNAHNFINDWGFARAGNPSGHQGTDIFGIKGTPLVAVADGMISDEIGPLRIGGFRLHVIADNGVDYYYAHLNNDTPGTDDQQGGALTAYAPGIRPGVRVKKGQLIGFLGDSGDAESTPAHLHFGIRVNGQWINPYPFLRAADWK